MVSTAPVGAARSRPLARSALGSTFGGAVSPNGLTEGVHYNEWYMPMVLNSHCRGRQLGDPKLTLQSALLNGTRQRLLSSWLPPGGSCHDEISASRNRYFVVTDEGWRWLKVSTAVPCFVETKANAIHLTAYIYQPVATPHQAFLSTGSEVPFDKNPASPLGEAKGQLRELVPFNVLLCSIRKWAAAPQREAKSLPYDGRQGCFAPGNGGTHKILVCAGHNGCLTNSPRWSILAS